MKAASRPASAPRGPRRDRRAISHAGGPVVLRGGTDHQRRVLESSLRVTTDEAVVMAHVHGFHSYPARMHPQTAARLIDGLSASRARVLDPFCGSGTVLVEARLAGRGAFGVDANPLAVELTWVKTGGIGQDELGELLEGAQQVVLGAEERRLRRAGSTRRYGKADRELFPAHVLLELDGLRHGISGLELRPPVRRALALVLSSLLTKVSLRLGDTTERLAPRRLAAGYTLKLFLRKTELLVRQLGDFWARVPPGTPAATVKLDDARSLRSVPTGSADLVVTSPPYPGVYDYHTQHAARLRWLGLEGRGFEKNELGPRRRLVARDYRSAMADWDRELGTVLKALRRVVRPEGVAALVVGDSVLAGRAVRGDETVESAAVSAGFQLLALASQPRPHFHAPSARAFRDRPRAEHVILLGRRPRATG